MIILGPVAVAKNGVIGNNNDLPWYIPDDLKRFRELTSGHTVIMGRRTFESIYGRLGKPLPNRVNIVITSKILADHEGVLVYNSLPEALDAHKDDSKIFLIGGTKIFEEGIKFAEHMYVTHVHKNYDGDVYFPEIDWKHWEKIDSIMTDDYEFAEYKRIVKGGE
jgi:dihydrofolate reductase